VASQDNQRLLLTIDANVELLRRNLASAERDVAGFERQVNNGAAGIESGFDRMQAGGVRALGALSAAVAAFGVAGLVQVGRTVLQLGDDLEAAASKADVSVERYQTLREGLRSLEVTAEQTDNILKRLSDTLGAVQGGTAAEGVTAALDKMGITARILNGEIDSTDELFDAIAGSATSFATEAQFTASVVDILGRKLGVDFAAAVRDGGTALKEQERLFRETGAVISEEYVADLAAANEAIDSFVERSKGQLAIWAVDAVRNAGIVANALRISATGTTGIAGFYDLALAEKSDRDLKAQLGRTAPLSMLNPLRPAGPMDGGSIADVVVSARRSGGSGGGAPSRRVTPARRSASGVPTLSPAQIRYNETAGQSVLDNSGGELGNAERLKQTFLEILDLTGQIENAQIVNPEAEAGARNVASNLAQAFVYGQSIGDALVNSFKAAVAEALANGLFDLLLGGKGGGGGILGTILSSFGGARANGGPVSNGRAYLVGERGPELFVPSASGMIRSNASITGGGGVSFDLRGAVMTSDLLQQMEQMAARSGGIAFMGARSYTNSSFEAASRPKLPRGAGA
jgi:hypothetical protein